MTTNLTRASVAPAPIPSQNREPLRVFESDNGCLTDQYDRDHEDCAKAAKLARSYASSACAAAAACQNGGIVLGRLGGGRQVQRLDTIAVLFERVAARDNTWAERLERLDEERER